MNLRKFFPLLILLLLVSCGVNDKGSAMKINWQTPTYWGTPEYSENSDRSNIRIGYSILDGSNLFFHAQRFPTNRAMNKDKEDSITLYREIVFDEQIAYVEKSNEYQMSICGQDAVILEGLFLPNKIGVSASYDVSSIVIWFSLDRTLYYISFASNEMDEEISDVRIEDFWNMIENIECPNE